MMGGLSGLFPFVEKCLALASSGGSLSAWHKFQQLRKLQRTTHSHKQRKMSATVTDDDSKKRDWLGVGDSEAEEDAVEEKEESRVEGILRATKRQKVVYASEYVGDNEEDEDEEEEEEEKAAEELDEAPKGEKDKRKGKPKSKVNDDELLFTNPNKLKPLTQDELAASKLATSKTGVIYLSRIPVYPHPPQYPNLVVNC